ncbi:hypothetical protein [Asticcacaulis solisilvae]|uniref:hypothetical protein n=1 Tax=Asticcacaulis solisilvae TaxID=1217274 RepID=UPI003FD73948
MASKYQLKRPLLTAIVLSIVGAFGLKFYQAFAHHAFYGGVSPETLGYIAGTGAVTTVAFFIPIALVLLIWQGIAGLFGKKARA